MTKHLTRQQLILIDDGDLEQYRYQCRDTKFRSETPAEWNEWADQLALIRFEFYRRRLAVRSHLSDNQRWWLGANSYRTQVTGLADWNIDGGNGNYHWAIY